MPTVGYAKADALLSQSPNRLFLSNRQQAQIKDEIQTNQKLCRGVVNYAYYQAEQLCSIGSGAVESAIKQIGIRLKLSGGQWHPENVSPMLQLRCAYLNGQLPI